MVVSDETVLYATVAMGQGAILSRYADMMTISWGKTSRFFAFLHAKILCFRLAEILPPSHRIFAESNNYYCLRHQVTLQDLHRSPPHCFVRLIAHLR